MSNRNTPWRAHPSGVWAEKYRQDAGTGLVEFGGEAEIELRAWVGGEDFTLTPIGFSREHQNDSGTWAIGTVEEEAETQRRVARTAHGRLCVEVKLTDRSGRTPQEMDALLVEALDNVHLDWIAARVRPTLPAPTLEQLRPWPLPPGHPLYNSHACTVLPNGLRFGVALVHPPWASLVGPDHPWWHASSPERLLHRAVVHLIADALHGRLPLTRRSIGNVHALAIGPHPLAPAALLLPDLPLLARDVTGQHGPLHAIPIRSDLLLVATERVQAPPDAWMPAIQLGSGA